MKRVRPRTIDDLLARWDNLLRRLARGPGDEVVRDRLPAETDMKMEIAILKGGQHLMTHGPAYCAGQPCCIHSPTDHHMKEWDQNWRDDAYKMERMCKHGIGHPDPDHVAFMMRVGAADQSDLVHGCDGCCKPNPGARL